MILRSRSVAVMGVNYFLILDVAAERSWYRAIPAYREGSEQEDLDALRRRSFNMIECICVRKSLGTLSGSYDGLGMLHALSISRSLGVRSGMSFRNSCCS